MIRLVILRISESYFRHRWLYLLPIIFMWGIAAIFISREPVYLANGVLYVEQESFLSSLISIQDTNFSWGTPADQTSQEITELLRTDAFIRAIITETGLEEHMNEGTIVADRVIRDTREAVWTNTPGNNLVMVAATDPDPEIAYQLVNAIIENYTQWKINANRVESVTAQAFFDDLLTQYDSDFKIANRELENYLMAHPEPIRNGRSDLETLEIDRLQFDVDFASSRYAETLRLREDAELAASRAESEVRQTYSFIDAPRVPIKPETSLKDIAIQLIIFTVVGVILSTVGIIGSMLLDRSFRFPIDVQYGVNLPVIASIPNVKE